MHILAFILMFLVGSIAAACEGDFSGIVAIGKFVGFIVLLFAIMWIFTQPAILLLLIAVIIVAFAACFLAP